MFPFIANVPPLGFTTTQMHELVHYYDHTTALYPGLPRPGVTRECSYALCYTFELFG
jgi:hypothetical protein